jgi:predicted GIY-YIG superfamily endonuclease
MPLSMHIYILLLENNYYYIGESSNFIQSYQQHIDKRSADWTKLHRTVTISKVIQQTNEYTVNDCVIEYMKKYGIDKVRGGSFSDVVLSSEQLDLLSNYL